MRIENGKLVDLNDLESKAKRLLWDYVFGVSVDVSDVVRVELAKFCISYSSTLRDYEHEELRLAFETAEDWILIRLLRIEKDYIESVSKLLEKEEKKK